VAVGLRDTTGRRFGRVREPWSLYTVEGLFDAVEQAARRNDVFDVTYDPRFGYPTYMHGDARLGLPDDWFWVRATELTPRR
jgi:cytochrome oxidase Cu insertion factor (SCO1/SenC/PrrC family)